MKDHSEDFADQLGRHLVRAGLTQQELASKIGMHRNTIVKWMNRTSWPTSRGRVLRIADELSLLKEERKALTQAAGFSLEQWPTEIWTVPQPRDMFFTGRDTVCQSLRELLVPGSTTALTQAITGLGGIGKTHTAVEYAYRFHKDYEAVLWLQADSWEILVSACIELADELELPEQKEADQVVAEVRHWLRKHRHWLLILDNMENPQEILPKFVPTGHLGCVLVTTRVHNVEPLAQTQVLAMMSEQEGVLFLLRRTKKIAPAAGLEQASSAQRDEARQIWQLMDGLPLALDQAGAYILETSCSFPAYREQYSRRREELLHLRGKRFIGHEASVTTTFSLAFERIEVLNPVAADILQACSFLHSEAIPEELFQAGAEHLGPRLATERGRWDLALAVLQDYSLVQRNTDAKTLTIHRLVQAVLQDMLEESERHIWAQRAVLSVKAAFPQVGAGTWPQCERLLPHALVAAQLIKKYHISRSESARLLYKTASYLQDRARFQEAEPLYKDAWHIQEQALSPKHPDVAYPLNSLARLYYDQGKYELAEPLFKHALHIWEQAPGPEHSRVAYPLINLANLYREQGKYELAEPLYRRALYILEQAQGPEHPDVATSLNNLATLYREQGKYAEAELCYQHALRIREQSLGLEHHQVAYSLNSLATLYREQGKYAEAELCYQRALPILEQSLGPEHHQVARSLNGLATLYREQGKYTEAEPLYQRALHIRTQCLGSQHPETANVIHNVAQLRDAQGSREEAKALYEQALAVLEQALGDNHPKTTETRKRCIALLQAMGRHEKAPLLGAAYSEQGEREEEQTAHLEE